MGGGILALGLRGFAEVTAEDRAARDLMVFLKLAVGLESRHRHGRSGGEVFGVERFEEGLREGRELGLHFHPHTRGQEGEPLEEALGEGIVAPVPFQREAAGDFRVSGGEISRHAADVSQLAFVEFEQGVVHFN